MRSLIKNCGTEHKLNFRGDGCLARYVARTFLIRRLCQGVFLSVNQRIKVRPIDDFSQSQVNSTVTTYEQATVDGPDVICALAVKLMKSLRDNGCSSQFVGRALDLASAYRQVAVVEDSYDFAFLSIFDPDQREAALYPQVALPFGSVTAVNAFIRCLRFLQWAAGHCLNFPMSYFDDFVIFSPPGLANSS